MTVEIDKMLEKLARKYRFLNEVESDYTEAQDSVTRLEEIVDCAREEVRELMEAIERLDAERSD